MVFVATAIGQSYQWNWFEVVNNSLFGIEPPFNIQSEWRRNICDHPDDVIDTILSITSAALSYQKLSVSIACYCISCGKNKECIAWRTKRSNWQPKCFFSFHIVHITHSVYIVCHVASVFLLLLLFFVCFVCILPCFSFPHRCNMSWFCFIVMNVLLITSSLLVCLSLICFARKERAEERETTITRWKIY